MNLLELKTKVDKTIEHLPNKYIPEEINVYITLSEPSIGCRAFTEISAVALGIDWENKQFRIQPKDKLKNIKTTKFMYEIEYDEFVCSNCNAFLQDNFKYCPKCGREIVK